MSTQRPAVQDVPRGVRRALALLVLRLILVLLTTLVAWGIVSAAGGGSAFPPNPLFASLSLIPVNVICLLVALRLLRSDGQRLRDLFGYTPGSWRRDTAWGLLWVMVLFVPFAGAIMGTAWLLHGERVFVAFETMFYNPDAMIDAPPVLLLTLGIVAFVTFAPLNAPTEEIVFRGYAQSRLTAAWPTAVAILLTSVAFGLQHALFAPTTDAMIVYVAAFTCWGLGSAVIVLWQRRLLPITIAHFVVNLFTSSPALVFPILLMAGVI